MQAHNYLQRLRHAAYFGTVPFFCLKHPSGDMFNEEDHKERTRKRMVCRGFPGGTVTNHKEKPNGKMPVL